MHRRFTDRTALVADVLLAVGVALAAAGSALSGSSDPFLGGSTAIVGDRYLVAIVYVLAGLALAFRRGAPLAVFLVVTGLLSLLVLFVGATGGFAVFVALLIALYTVCAHCERRVAFFALGVFTGFWALVEARDPLNHDLGDVLGGWPVYLILLLAWLAGGYVRARRLYVQELRDRAERAELAQGERVRVARADERARIARELHDAVAHTMTVMVMQAEAADEVFTADPEAARAAIGRVQQAGREGLTEMRRLVDILRRDDVGTDRVPQPGLSALPDLVDTVRETGLAVAVTIEGMPGNLPAGVDISAYRIVQEALTNAIKHANATAVRVTISYDDHDGVELEVVDNGEGLGRVRSDGHGLIGMRERVALYGGTLQAGAAAGGGFRVSATLPAVATG